MERTLNQEINETRKDFSKRALKEERHLNAESIEDTGDKVIIMYFESTINK